jgi:hypothetical protein
MADALPQLPNLLGPDVLAEAWAPYAFSLLLNGEPGTDFDQAKPHMPVSVPAPADDSIRCTARQLVGTVSEALHCVPAGAAAVKPAAARGLASLLRACRRERQRTDLYCRIMRELAWGRSCFARLAFIQVRLACAVTSCT